MKPETVMVIDDSEPDQFLVAMVLRKYHADISVIQAYNGQEALDKLSSCGQQPDVALLDVNMPRMDGFEFLEEYAKLPGQHMNVVVLSSSNNSKDIERALSYEFVKKYSIKPFSITLLGELGFDET